MYIKPYFQQDKRQLRLQNTGDTFFMDPNDWEKAKHCHWWIDKDGRVVNKSGIFFEDYVGIKGKRIPHPFKSLDFGREMYQQK